jgi:hypothetical protein
VLEHVGSGDEIFAVEKLREAALGTADSVTDAGLRRATPKRAVAIAVDDPTPVKS